ncbi:helix-turn-helix transcriptional regulator [Thermus neutrinimicus]|uniref:helix-turn-helix transcriptional regulator n=1 Tax=Thermus neutrinimicus TaxID=2908149 RepID=UPI001FAA8356|nr:response regulator transcription factor [Thermus neutrinimicus]
MIRVWLNLALASQQEALAEALKARGFQVAEHPFNAQVGLLEARWELPPPPPVPAVVLLQNREQATQALRLGYKGYLYPEQGLEVLAQALRKVAEGEIWAERRVVAQVVGEPIPQLSPREKEVAALAALGLSNKEIAQELGISERTVKAHLSAVFQKAGVKRRSQLAHQYIAAKLNVLKGAYAPPEVLDAITWAENFFHTYGPASNLSKSLVNQARYYAGILGQYNEGKIGPGHCSE